MKIERDAKQREIRSGCKRAGKTSTMFSPRSTDMGCQVRPQCAQGKSSTNIYPAAARTRQPKVLIKTFGCQMNERDSEGITSALIARGYELAQSEKEADVVIFNTCSVREHAEDRVWGKLGLMTHKGNGKVKIGVVGCMAQRYQGRIFDKMPQVDFVAGPANLNEIPSLLKEIDLGRGHLLAFDGRIEARASGRTTKEDYREHRASAYVKIMEGCDNFCSYCIVPFLRGRERSRPAREILDEMKALAQRGFKEVILLGQNVNSYRGLAYSVERIAYRKKLNAKRYPLNAKTCDFVRLLEDLNKIDGIERIRFLTSHPKDASEELFRAMRDLPKVCEHIHLPVQSGSDRILELMNRNYTESNYLKLVDAYRRFLPDGSITTDIIVGFPTEREQDFCATKGLMGEVEFDSAFIFKYSPRPPAESSELKDNILREVKEERLKALLELQDTISLRKNKALINRKVEILVEGRNPRCPKELTGKTRTGKNVLFIGGDEMIGRLISLEIVRTTAHTLIGEARHE